MHTHRLPWPVAALEELDTTEVKSPGGPLVLIEPNPGTRGRDRRYSYASYGLRFDVQGKAEDPKAFEKRLNAKMHEEGDRKTRSDDTKEWAIGPDARSRGSLHVDLWRGPAIDLARRGVVGVYPVTGWWKFKKEFWGRTARYALLVSIETPETDVDIYTPVLQEIQTLVTQETGTEIVVDGE